MRSAFVNRSTEALQKANGDSGPSLSCLAPQIVPMLRRVRGPQRALFTDFLPRSECSVASN